MDLFHRTRWLGCLLSFFFPEENPVRYVGIFFPTKDIDCSYTKLDVPSIDSCCIVQLFLQSRLLLKGSCFTFSTQSFLKFP